jgi:hypothetical protein
MYHRVIITMCTVARLFLVRRERESERESVRLVIKNTFLIMTLSVVVA